MKDDVKVRIESLCRRYLQAMESGDLAALLALFTEDASATSPISGAQPARDFYRHVMDITSDRSMALKTIFIGASDPRHAAIHMSYTRSVLGKPPSTIEGVDVFSLNGDCSRFTSVTIIYDTAPVRSEFDSGC
ncbi:nuclear transport factor 2 family protein [Microbulbifer taiwanensis]|uniref:Nuclear transport factor 2 family protein n=1 Tax=Microbulbifer taiwanensis TaxID=986746 RepID=A0ABW1YKX1_9GAMM|nr:nuclear transport factor 2 family protein [Microbulbifer taiwanensis]